jgi:hypothetical protein
MRRIQSRLELILSLASILVIFIILPFRSITPSQSANEKENIILGNWTENKLNDLLLQSSKIADSGERIDFLSGQFLDVGYKESTLIGDSSTPEVFIINLEGMDCFTYIDYVEAMRLSQSFTEFEENLKDVRYQSGEVSFLNRNHFFTDWQEFNKGNVNEVTEEVGGDKTRTVVKVLNKKEDGTYFLPGIPVKQKEVKYIPSDGIDDEIIGRLKTGDYVGIYSDIQGLDVSHTGIIIKKGDKVYLRHASSREANRKVVDEDFKEYIATKSGLVVFRSNCCHEQSKN